MGGRGFRHAVSAVISLGLLAWALYLIHYGWDFLQSVDAHWRQGGHTLVAGGLLLLAAALAGIIHAIMRLRVLAKRRKQPRLEQVPSVDTTG
jgi:hypothetical protein